MTDDSLSHVDPGGKLRMVDVSTKDVTERTARASCVIETSMALDALAATATGLDPVQSARLSGIMAAKRTDELIPLCHPLELTNIQVDVAAHARGIEVLTSVTTVGRTGVEMEALAACGVTAVSILGAIRELESSATIYDLHVESKTGGKSDWGREISQGSAPKPLE